MGHVFQNEAEQLWPAYRGSDSITNLSATSVFSIACIWLGKGELGQNLLTHSRAMADRLGLFGSAEAHTVAARYSQMTAEDKRATSHAAWGSYGYIT